ncbi:MAG: ANTAR domain-containing protein [Acidimicrobiales bacterium]
MNETQVSSRKGSTDVDTQESIIQALVSMADVLVEDFDVVDMLTGLARRCVDLLGMSAAGVMIADPTSTLHVIASSSEEMRVLELFELQSEQGPCVDAYLTGEIVHHQVLRTSPETSWPLFSQVALDAGFHAVSALPLRLRDTTIGALNLFSTGRTPMTTGESVVARAFADLATISIIQHRSTDQLQRINDQLSHALNSRILIEQAKGIIAERANIDLQEAFNRLRRYTRDHNLRLTDVASAAVAGTLDSSAWGPKVSARPTARPQADLGLPRKK